MCGICGKWNPSGVDLGELRSMSETLAHRGPDDVGFHMRGPIGISSRRLSIIDLVGGHQPLSNEDGSVWLVFNGEIYNYQKLRLQLERNGHRFRTRTDTEVIVHLYEEYGVNCVKKLRGMFAFALWDEQRNRLVLARDRIGQKPMYYSWSGSEFIFASEQKALLTGNGIDQNINFQAVSHYLSLRFFPSPLSMFREIEKLPPAHLLVFEGEEPKIEKYWSLSFREKSVSDEVEAIGLLHEKLLETIESHLVADVQVGAFLSGGMDSSMIVALATRDLGAKLNTFSVGVDESDFNELPYAHLVARHAGTSHQETSVSSQLLRMLPRIVWHLDEPTDPIAACQFVASQFASQSVKVVLGGDGGDELFAGFDRYRWLSSVASYQKIPRSVRHYIFDNLINLVPESFSYKSMSQKIRWLQHLSRSTDSAEMYAEATTFFRFCHESKRRLFTPSWWQRICRFQSTEVISEPFSGENADNLIDRMLYADFVTRLPEHSLMLTDKMGMSHGLEVRSPFLDHELVELLASFPANLKLKGGTLKYLLRELSKQYLPDEIWSRKKQGFMFPIAYWFRGEILAFLQEAILNSWFVTEGIFRREEVIRLIEDHREGRIDNHVRLWMLLSLEVWHRLFVQGIPLEVIEEDFDIQLNQGRHRAAV